MIIIREVGYTKSKDILGFKNKITKIKNWSGKFNYRLDTTEDRT